MLVSEQYANLSLEELQPEVHDALTDEDVDSIRALFERSQEVMNHVNMDKMYSAELISKFKKIAPSLGRSYHITPRSIFEDGSQISDIVLTPDAILSFYCNTELVVSKPLESMTSEVLIRMLNEILPTIQSLAIENIQNRPKQTRFQRLASDIKNVFGFRETLSA